MVRAEDTGNAMTTDAPDPHPGGTFLLYCGRPRNLRRAAVTSAIVGPVLTLINQTAVVASLAAFEPVPIPALVRIGLTFAVPFVVSLVSSALADRARESR